MNVKKFFKNRFVNFIKFEWFINKKVNKILKNKKSSMVVFIF